ncbi:ATP-binding protein [Mesorhizobium sp. B4-1-3]|uniref:ATP-binding protein n=1 Tax=Mesorhizobium sp. B4-1-3 TaxID=2589889 RepID=UPI0011272368|nr:ATP-binding protein [Mesorhizobium sp. B4-1-3]TPI09914.1 ATP-binding protein [Mesorhizobium sp. B4-1-3]
MKFLILRVLTHSELGMFHEYRRQGKEGSKQRAINFDSDVVDRVFPTASDADRIALELCFDCDAGTVSLPHFLTRQAKNWRLEGNCPRDRRYAFVEPGCLFVMEVDAGRKPAEGAWVVLPDDDPITRVIRADGATAGLTRAGMIALHDDEGRRIRALLHDARPEMFSDPARKEETMTGAPEAVPGGKRLPPRPQRLAEIIANTGHTLASAVADIVDNSISADATLIDIDFAEPDSGHGRWLTIRDNGRGMSPTELDEAMTLGSLVDYEGNSLGKFGYGLKGASWSQARVFTVVTRKRGGPVSHLTWDRDQLGDWIAGDGPLEAWEEEATKLEDQGTVVLWKEMKPPAAAQTINGIPPWSMEILELGRHLGLVFHRFLEGDARNRKMVVIRINTVPVVPNNPVGHALTVPYDLKTIRMVTPEGDQPVTVQPFLLPSEDELRQHHKPDGPIATNEVLGRVGLFGRRNETQGLFIYRNDRLIKWGGWQQIWLTSDEKTKLARVVVSFDTKLDEMFDINITKRSVSLPSYLQEEIKKLATPVRTASKGKYKKPTSAPVPKPSPSPAPTPTPAPTPIAGLVPGPGDGLSIPGADTSLPTVTTAGPPETPADLPPINYRPVTATKFAWKQGINLSGGRDLQISGRIAPLAALAARLEKDPEAMQELAAFLMLLDEKDMQTALLASGDK